MTNRNLTFGQAIESLKTGDRVARRGWNGKGMYIFLNNNMGKVIDNGTIQQMEPCIVMKTALGDYQPGWLASQMDILSEDWEVV